MDIKKAAYWGTSGLIALAMAASCAGYLSGAMDEEMANLGFNHDFAVLLGSWKGLAALGLLIPAPAPVKFIKEWCYAGLFFTFTGAIYFHLVAGDPVTTAIPPLVMGLITSVSWFLRPDRQPTAAG